MPKIDGSYVDNHFGKKIDHLAGVIGYQHEPMMFRSNYLARIFCTSDASMRRKRIGKEAVLFRELSILIKISISVMSSTTRVPPRYAEVRRGSSHSRRRNLRP